MNNPKASLSEVLKRLSASLQATSKRSSLRRWIYGNTMMFDLEKELSKINFDANEVDVQELYSLVDKIKELPNQREYIPKIFIFIERHADKDLGSPDPLVHFLEEESDYLDDLKESLRRKPTNLTVWMVNRILIASLGDNYEEWIDILNNVANHSLADDEAKKSAGGFLEYQREKI